MTARNASSNRWLVRVMRQLIIAISKIVPEQERDGWLEEWRSELWHWRSGRVASSGSPTSLAFLGRTLSAVRHALWIRRDLRVMERRIGNEDWLYARSQAQPGLRTGNRFQAAIDVKLALRTLGKTPFTTFIAVVSLALGIGANAAMFSLLDQVVLRPLPVNDPGTLVNLAAPGPKAGAVSCNDAGDCDAVFSYPMFRDLERQQTSLTGIAAHRSYGANLTLGHQTVKGEVMLVSGSYFPVLGVRATTGRLIGPSDDERPGEHSVAVLSHNYWRARLGADPGILNSTIVVNGHSMTVVGVAERGFAGTTLGTNADVFVPLTMRGQVRQGDPGFDNRNSYWAYLFGRRRADVSIDAARAELNTLYTTIVNELEAPQQGSGLSEQTMAQFRAKEIVVEPGARGQSSMHAEVRTPLILLLATTGVVLLIACANIANLLLARGRKRMQEMAVRESLGATRWQLVTQLLTESCSLAVLGGATSLILARLTLGGIALLLPADAGAIVAFELRTSIIAFTGALAIGTGFLFGLYPALHHTGHDVTAVLKGASGQSAGSRAAARFRGLLMTSQVALCTMLLFVAGLFIKSLINVSRVDLGLNVQNVVTFRISPGLNGYESARSQVLFERVQQELSATPSVTSVAAALVPILTSDNWGASVSVEGFESGPDVDSYASYNQIGAGYFSTLGIPLLAGREFEASDAANAPKVAVVNEAFARKFGLTGRAAVGKWMAPYITSDLNVQIVGVIGNAKYSDVKQETPPVFFLPYRQNTSIRSMTFYARTSGDPAPVLGAVAGVMDRLDPNLPIENLRTLDQQAKENVMLDRLISMLSAAFAGVATLLAAVGVYGVLAFTVAQRTREFGLRMALGADGSHLRNMILLHAGRMTVTGGAIGLVTALVLGRAARSLLFGIEAHDPMVVGMVGLLVAAVALGAAYVPARRATLADPVQSLRTD